MSSGTKLERLIEKDINYITINMDIRPGHIKSTDHMAVSLKIKYKNKRGIGTWKMNNNLLNKIEYINLTNDTIDETLITCSKTDLDCRKIWDYCKYVIKYKTIQYAKTSTKTNLNEIKN